jgi:hypothetical protein
MFNETNLFHQINFKGGRWRLSGSSHNYYNKIIILIRNLFFLQKIKYAGERGEQRGSSDENTYRSGKSSVVHHRPSDQILLVSTIEIEIKIK